MSFPRYPSYKDSGVEWLGKVPSHWGVAPFKWQLERNDGGVWGDDPDGINDTIVLRSTEQTVDGRWQLDDPAPRKLSEADISGSLLVEGDLLLTKSSGSSLHIGKTTLVTPEIAAMRCCYSNFMQRIRTKSSFFPKLAWHVLNNDLARLQFDLLSNSTTGLANLNGTMIGQIVVPVPPVAEQTAIAAFLDRETEKIDELVAEQRRLMELLKEKRQAVISHAVTRGLNPAAPLKPSGIEWLGDVPAHWEVRRLCLLADFESGMAHEPFVDDNGEYIYVNARFVSTGGELRKFCTQNLSPAKKNDVLMVMSDLPNGRALAKAFFVSDDGPYAVNQRVAIIRATTANPRFLSHFLNRNPGFLMHDDGVNQTHLWNDLFKKFPTLVPPDAEQRKIAEFIDAQTAMFDTLTAEAQRAIDLLQERRTALISAAVTGQIDVRAAIA